MNKYLSWAIVALLAVALYFFPQKELFAISLTALTGFIVYMDSRKIKEDSKISVELLETIKSLKNIESKVNNLEMKLGLTRKL